MASNLRKNNFQVNNEYPQYKTFHSSHKLCYQLTCLHQFIWKQKIYILFKMHKIIVLIALLALTSALHTHHSIEHLLASSLLHASEPTKSPAFEEEFSSMKNIVDNISKTLTAKDPKKYEFLITKTNQMQAGFNKLQETLQSFNLPVTSTSQLCPGVTTFNRTELRRYITYLQQKQTITVEYLSTCLDCAFVTDDIFKIQKLTNTYLKNLNKTLDGAYCKKDRVGAEKPTGIVNLNSSYFKNNLNAKNWYYGSTTASDYKIYIFKRSSSYNLTNCPIQTPFVKDEEQICFNCPEGSIFNLGDQKCDTCKTNQILNIQSGRCDECLGEKKFINGSLVCQLCVLAEGKLFNATNGKCYTCDNNSYLDTVKLACIPIDCDPLTPRFNRTTHQCSACGPSEIIDPNDITKCIKTNFVGLCPPATPLYDSKTKECVACPNNTVYIREKNQCNPQTSPSHFQAFNLTHNAKTSPTHLSVKSHTESANSTNSTQVTKGCPTDKPRYNNESKQCEACQTGYIYYNDTKQCEKHVICGETQTLNRTSSSCVDTASTCRHNEVYVIKINRCLPKSITCNEHQYYNPELQACISIQSNCSREEFYDQKTRKCTSKSLRCKSNQNYNEDLHICQKMILCKADEELNYKLRICEKKKLKCNQETEYFDEHQLACEPYSFITSPYTPNLIYRDDWSSYINLYKNQKKQNIHLKDCPLKSPYHQKSTGTCIKCQVTTPYFDIDQDKCVSCLLIQEYSPSTHRCRTKSTPPSNTISRMNI